jgi:hypothetical protein
MGEAISTRSQGVGRAQVGMTARPPPADYGLVLAALVSIGLWTAIGWLVAAALVWLT